MSLINRAIASLFNGVSQQPPALRAESQSEAIENAYITVAEGVRKRPPTYHVAKAVAATPAHVKVHFVHRSATEQYVISAYDEAIAVNDAVTGASLSVDTTTFPSVLSYLDSTNPIEDFDFCTVADTTYIVNRKKTVTASSSGISTATPTVYVVVKEGRADSGYTVTIDGLAASFSTTSTASTYATTNIAEQLRVAIAALSGGTVYTATRYGSLIVVTKAAGASMTVTWADSQGNGLMSAFLNRVERYSDLPRYFVHNAVVEVRGTADSGNTGYWVKFVSDTATSGGGGHWEETVKPLAGEVNVLDATTMPVALVRLTATTFRLERPTWNNRLVGSTATTTKPPSFVGSQINAAFFWRDRLGFLSGENVILSRAGDVYNLWPKSSIKVNDDDPIDVTVNAPKVAILRHAVPFQRNLVVFSESAQFQVTSEGPLTPRTVKVDVATEFSCNVLAKPVSSGRDVYFAFERSSPQTPTYSGLREYYIDANAVSNAANDVTAHVPRYILKDVHRISSSSTEDLVLMLTRTAYNEVYCYKLLWNGDEKVQSAWFKWVFRPSDKILAAEIHGSSVYLMIQRYDGIFLERMDLPYAIANVGIGGNADFHTHLDRQVAITGTYSAITGETTWTVPYEMNEGTPEGVTPETWGVKRARRVPLTKKTLTTVTAAGDWTAHPMLIGLQYTFRLRLSQFFMRDRKDQAIETGRLQLRYLTVKFRDSGYFRVEVTTDGRDTAQYVWSPLRLGKVIFKVDTPVIDSGTYSAPIASRSDRATIDIINDSPYPSCVYALEWEGTYTNRATRV